MSELLHDEKQIIARLMAKSASPLTIWFALEMQYKLDMNRLKSGWERMTNKQILRRIKQEVKELEGAIKEENNFDIIGEATDIANFCSFIAHNSQKKRESK